MLKVDNSSTILKNHIVFVLDESGSMAGLKLDVVKVCNQWFEDLRKQSVKHKQETVVSFITFGTRTKTCFKFKSLEKLKLDEHLYNPDGLTALFKGVHEAIDLGDELDGEYSNVVVVITDGLENNSGNYAKTAPQLIKNKQNDGNWSFVFLVPPGQADGLSKNFSVPEDNIREWKSTSAGIKSAAQQTSSGIANYYTSRSRGLRSTSNFFVDASQLKVKEVKSNLDDISNDCEMFQVPKECAIKEFVESKTGRPYTVGTGFYELTKPERVQAYKDILINKRGTRAIYGGEEARSLLNIPEGQEVKLEPKNMGEWRVFVNSQSVNRKLVRGTSLIIKE